ncbi:4'-phosphopantetheinyl transferase superfamily protein [uncultured Herbaspirillum sp.]|jgi:4'-phosphopantetheinyl transferase|uniref:4'-phosphopantetheinyl transferase family protein n=1 Tax=uncultured Herbaspirillum sp. TaxID=160236 RepID=UPI0026170376|nr:4'-phosphopantetheinyl transferase superfamily protein [uncultured Herbaspirillum sp.]
MAFTVAWVVDGRSFVGAGACSSTLARLAAVLSPNERMRLQGFLRPQRAGEFLLARLLMRHALMQVSGCRLDDIAVSEPGGAAPVVRIAGELADGVGQPTVSLSHSRGWIACAVGVGTQIGVDIEAPAPERDLSALAELAFTPHELSSLEGLTGDQREAAFYRLWCAKEADYKCRHNARQNQVALTVDAPSFLHHEPGAHYHLCLCTTVPVRLHPAQDIALPTLLELTGSQSNATPQQYDGG